MTRRLPVYFISHGGGPWTHMKAELGNAYDVLEASLKDIPRQIGVKPKAVLVISGHWEERDFTVMATPQPPMIYDYGGFPAHTYDIHYRAPGSPEVAARVHELLKDTGVRVKVDTERGYDHGTFVPMFVVYPDADVPVLQLSIRSDYDPAAHVAVGRALAPLRDQGVLIIGSGLSYHNLRLMGPSARQPSKAFDSWLQETVVQLGHDERTRRLIEWSRAPAARIAHPQEDHLLPLMVAAGAAENDDAVLSHHEDDFFGGVAVSSFRFGEAARP
jgi:aromatic ring-opening dioxygenase catalytic subunit (LigB family)